MKLNLTTRNNSLHLSHTKWPEGKQVNYQLPEPFMYKIKIKKHIFYM